MTLHCLVAYPGLEQAPAVVAVKCLPDLLKAHPEGLYRYPFLFETPSADEVKRALPAGTLPVTGPLVITHATRRAADLLLEDAACEGLTIQLEVEGNRLPELPARAELEALLKKDATLVLIDGKTYKPGTEVLGFQHVYDDTVRFIDQLKKLGIPQDSLLLLATAEEISVEVHPGVFGLGLDPRVPTLYTALLQRLGGIKRGPRGLLKTADRTLLLSTTRATQPILVPGSVHPALHRPKVGVGPSHFAYGIAAFSDFCGKKRTLDECLKEVKTWLKFIETEVAAVPKLKETLTSLEPLEAPRAAPTATGPGGAEVAAGEAAASGPATPAPGGFRPFAQEIRDLPPAWEAPAAGLLSPWAEWNRALGGGLAVPSLHLVAGAREEGKAALLLNLAVHATRQASILYISRDHGIPEVAARLGAWAAKASLTDLAFKRATPGPEAATARDKLAAGLTAALGGVGDHLYFRGADSTIDPFDLDGLAQLIKMLPVDRPRLLALESLPAEAFGPQAGRADLPARLARLARDLETVIVLSLHIPAIALPRPHLIDGPDLDLLAIWQPYAESITHVQSEKINLKKFLAMSQGKVDPAIAEKLEARFLQGAGGLRLKSDTFSLLRVIHARRGTRQTILALYQRDLQRFIEGPTLPLGRP